MSHQIIDGIPVWGEPLDNAVEQMKNVRAHGAAAVALMADHHLGYSQPIGGVVAYEGVVSPSGVGYDIACGNMAARLDVPASELRPNLGALMDEIVRVVSFGVGRKNAEPVEHALFEDDPAWQLPHADALRDMARAQLGTVGSGNHYVDLFEDERGDAWIGVHFGSRGLGHKLATHYVAAAGGVDSIDAAPSLLATDHDLGREYLMAMHLAGRYAYAGREWVVGRVAKILGGTIVESVHNHHNFAWLEEHNGRDLWVVRKGATPAFPGQRGFVGATMAEPSVILEGVDSPESATALYSTIHGAGRVMSRTQAAGKSRWKSGKKVRIREGEISDAERHEAVRSAGVVLRGGGNDEAPRAYKRLDSVLEAHGGTIRVIHRLFPMGVAMAGEDEFDPFKD